MAESVQASSAARVAWTQAEEVGRNRVISIIAATLAALIAVWIVVSTLRAARRSARRLASRAGRVGRARRAGAVPGPHLATAGRSRPLTQAHRPDSREAAAAYGDDS
jgi:hypothetical protein